LRKPCAYCGSKMGFARSFKGDLFCSLEHDELYRKEQSEKASARIRGVSAPPSSIIALASQVQPAPCQTVLNGAPKSADSQPAEVLSYSSTVASPTPLKVSAPEAQCVTEIGSAPSSLFLPDPTSLDQFEEVDLTTPPELRPPPSPAEADRLGAEPGAVARALHGLSDSFSQNTPTAASAQAESISAQVSDREPEKVVRAIPDNKELEAPKPRSSDETAMMKMVATAAGVVVGVSILAVIIAISSKDYLKLLKLTRIASPSQQVAVSNARKRQNQPVQTLPVAPQPGLPTSGPRQSPKQDSLKQFTGLRGQSASLDETQRVQPLGIVTPSVVSRKSRIAIKANQGSWIDVCTDGRTVVRKYLPQLSIVDLGFSNEAVVRLGNSGGVEISLNGTPTGQLGVVGQPRVVQFDAKGLRFLIPGDPGTECGR
jgi:hypothetical protein